MYSYDSTPPLHVTWQVLHHSVSAQWRHDRYSSNHRRLNSTFVEAKLWDNSSKRYVRHVHVNTWYRYRHTCSYNVSQYVERYLLQSISPIDQYLSQPHDTCSMQYIQHNPMIRSVVSRNALTRYYRQNSPVEARRRGGNQAKPQTLKKPNERQFLNYAGLNSKCLPGNQHSRLPVEHHQLSEIWSTCFRAVVSIIMTSTQNNNTPVATSTNSIARQFTKVSVMANDHQHLLAPT